MNVAFFFPLIQMSDAEYHSITIAHQRHKRLLELAPLWYNQFMYCQLIWVWSEFIILLSNEKRRALHDFLAGTVVVFATPKRAVNALPANGQD